MLTEVLVRIHPSRISELKELLTKNNFLYEIEVLKERGNDNRRASVDDSGSAETGEGEGQHEVEIGGEGDAAGDGYAEQHHLSNEYLEAKIDEMFDFGVDTDDKAPISPHRGRPRALATATATVQLDANNNADVANNGEGDTIGRGRETLHTPVREPSELRSRLNVLRQQGQGQRLVYSVSAYRNAQREHRVSATPSSALPVPRPSQPMPRFSPIAPPPAGQRLHAYRAKAIDAGIVGRIAISPTPRPRHRSSSTDTADGSRLAAGLSRAPPTALATSTPIGTAQMLHPFQPVNGQVRRINNDTTCFDETFVSSISSTSQRVDQTVDLQKQITKMKGLLGIREEELEQCVELISVARKADHLSQELSAQRNLLLARERIATLRAEIRRLSVLVAVRRPPPPVSRDLRGSMIISNIAVHLNRNFCHRHKQLVPDLKKDNSEDSSFAFVVLMKCGSEVEATGIVNLLANFPLLASHSSADGHPTLHFTEHIRFSNLPVDFNIRVEVYALRIRESHEEASCAAVLASKCRNLLSPTPRRRKSQRSPPTSAPISASAVRSSSATLCSAAGLSTNSEFFLCGHLNLTRETVGECRFFLDDAQYPLEGTVEMFTRCTTLPQSIELEHRGYLTMLKVIDGKKSWERYWAVLHRGVVDFWKSPEDEQLDMTPSARLRLFDCTNSQVSPCSHELTPPPPRPHTFSIEILVSDPNSTVESKRTVLSTESADLLISWVQAINETLAVIREREPSALSAVLSSASSVLHL